ncbi:restriction endonuclease subunit S [Plebeiibacterium sediminum]|uniref:Restriction endonuclease subunit S n=1 Tax=Plebeiibacterium sediminum TaxID=2992112 RepID=A0AAE3SDQ1_9BACT|nr:restriction endonuclease subunit S [Plebeiobacterium sediminum]MCW3785490.1 restriction endonuclease subunit S [Plebeiobacterium sediminum]
MKYRLNDIAQIYYGPYEKAETKGMIKYLVSSHFDEFFEPSLFKESYIDAIKDAEKYILRPNDIIVTGKGQRIFAWAYKEEYGQVIPSSLFYIIKINDSSKLIGEYLANVLNSQKVNHKLKSLSGGTSIPSIQKKELGQLSIYIPPIEKQRQIIDMSKLLDKDVELATQLLEKKKALKTGLLNMIINDNKTDG